MSLTSHIKKQSWKWDLISDVMDLSEVLALVNMINQTCYSRQVIVPDVHSIGSDYPWALVGGAMTYLPVLYDKKSIWSTYPARNGKPEDIDFILGLDPVQRLIALSFYGNLLREGRYERNQFRRLMGQKALTGSGVYWPTVYHDVQTLCTRNQWIHDEFAHKTVLYNIPPKSAFWVDGADVQMVMNKSDIWISFTTKSKAPMTVTKLMQTLAYVALDSIPSDTHWTGLNFYFPRHQMQISLAPVLKDLFKPRSDIAWSNLADAIIGKTLPKGRSSNSHGRKTRMEYEFPDPQTSMPWHDNWPDESWEDGKPDFLG